MSHKDGHAQQSLKPLELNGPRAGGISSLVTSQTLPLSQQSQHCSLIKRGTRTMQVSENPKSNVACSAKIAAFVTWVKTHLTGDEKGEAQIYLDRLFQAFGWPGLIEAGATCELRFKKGRWRHIVCRSCLEACSADRDEEAGRRLVPPLWQAFDYWQESFPVGPDMPSCAIPMSSGFTIVRRRWTLRWTQLSYPSFRSTTGLSHSYFQAAKLPSSETIKRLSPA